MRNDRVKEILKEIEDYLRRHRVNYATVIAEILENPSVLSNTQISKISQLEVRDLFGGMGSLNDIYISKANGHIVENEKEANGHLDKLRKALWNEITATRP